MLLVALPGHAVIAADDEGFVEVNTARILPVLDNDQRENPDATQVSICLPGNEADCPGLTATLTAPQKGRVLLTPNGRSIIYRPAQGQTGIDQFTYAVFVPQDGDVGAAVVDTATVSVAIATPEQREGANINLNRLETVFAALCDPAATSQIGDVEQQAAVIERCERFAALSDIEKLQALRSLTPEQTVVGRAALLRANQRQLGNVAGRLSQLRSGARTLSIDQLTYRHGDQALTGDTLADLARTIGGGASADAGSSLVSPWGLFLNGTVTRGDQAASELDRAYDLSAHNLTLGGDYRLSELLVVGIAAGSTRQDVDFDGSDTMQTAMTNVALYGSWQYRRWSLDAVVGKATGTLETQRTVSIGSINSVASGETDSSATAVSLAGYYDLISGSWSWNVMLGLDWVDSTLDAYTESGGQGFAVAFDKQVNESRRLTVGSQLLYVWSTSWGVLTPYVQLDALREFNEELTAASARFAIDPTGNDFSIATEALDDQWLQLGVGVSGVLKHGLSVYLAYERLVGLERLTQASVSAGGRWEARF